jgi:hypothetical protein
MAIPKETCAFVIFLWFSMSPARGSFAEASSALVRSSLEPACSQEIRKAQGYSLESWRLKML